MGLFKDVKYELTGLDVSAKNLRRFSLLMIILSVIAFISGYYFTYIELIIIGTAGIVLFASGLVIYQSGRILYKTWMGLAFFLGWISTRVLLFFIYYFFVTPIALVARLTGQKFLDTRFKDGRDSYWVKPKDTKNDYTKMS